MTAFRNKDIHVLCSHMDQAVLPQMKQSLQEATDLLSREGLHPVLCGSFALCLYAKSTVIDPQDIDLAFSSRKEQECAVRLLREEKGYILIKEQRWESETGEESINTVLCSPGQIYFDLSFSLGDLPLNLERSPTLSVDGYTVPILSLSDLLRSYERFGNEKPGGDEKRALIEELLHKQGTI